MSGVESVLKPTHRDGPMAFVADIDHPELSEDDRHHLSRVLRTRNESPMVVCDGAGTWRRAVFGAEIEVVGDSILVLAPRPRITVAFALTKGERPELVVQKLTEIGVDSIRAFTADHCVVRWDQAKADKQLIRMQRIAYEASMQCRRTHLPVIEPLGTFASLGVANDGERTVLAEAGGQPLSVFSSDRAFDSITIAIGPEGGWSEAELASGFATVGVGEHILRAETAAISAAVLMVSARSGIRAG